MSLSHRQKLDLIGDKGFIDDMLKTGVFDLGPELNTFLWPSLIAVLICLRDLMAKSEMIGKRIDFTDDVILGPQVKDVTDLIKHIRDAACHPESNKNDLQAHVVSFTAGIGKRTFMTIKGHELKGEYEDDTAFFFGEQRIYLKRHILRAYQEAQANLAKHFYFS